MNDIVEAFNARNETCWKCAVMYKYLLCNCIKMLIFQFLVSKSNCVINILDKSCKTLNSRVKRLSHGLL